MLTRLFWLWTVLGVIIAWFYPPSMTWFVKGKVVLFGAEVRLLSIGLGVIMLGMGMTLTFENFKEVLKTPRSIFIGILAQFLVMPFIGWSVATLFALPPELKLGIILVSCCPGGTASNVVCFLARANVALSVLITMCSTLIAVVMTPLLTQFYASAILKVDSVAMIQSMLTVVLLPVLGGLLLNHFFRNKLTIAKQVSPVIAVLVIVLIVGGVVGLTKPNIIKYYSTLLPAVFIVHILGFAAGYYIAKFLKLSTKDTRTVSIEVGMQNSGLGSQLATKHFTVLAATPCAISALYHCLIGSALAAYWSRKQE